MRYSPLRRFILAGLIYSGAAFSQIQAQTLLSRYTFDEGLTSTPTGADSGSGTAANLTFGGTSTKVTNTPGGSGFAFSTNGGAIANHAVSADADKVDTLTQFTLTGWINLQSAASSFDRIISDRASGANGFELIFNASNQLQLIVDGTALNSATTTAFATNTWVFLAVSYNGSATTNNVSFYLGGSDTITGTATQLGSAGTLNQGALSGNNVGTRIGGVDTAVTASDRTPNAFFDDMRVYSGLLNASAIEAVRLENLSTIPEPGSVAALMGVFAGGFAAYRRGARRRLE